MKRVVGLILCLLPWGSGALADFFVFGPDAATERQSVSAIDGSGQVQASGLVFVQGNAFVADAANDRLYFAERSGAGSRIVRMAYRSSSALGPLIELPNVSVTHLAYDAAPVPRLVVAARRNADGAMVLFPIVLSTLATGAEMVIPDDPILGVSAYRSSDDRWFLVAGSNPQQLVGIAVDTGLVTRWAIPDGTRLGALATHPGTQALWGLVDESTEGGTRLAALSPGGTLGIAPVGVVSAACCFVLGGAAAIDPAAGVMAALTRDRSGVTPMRPLVITFDLTTGARTFAAELPGNALFHDTGLVLPDLFVDGFE